MVGNGMKDPSSGITTSSIEQNGVDEIPLGMLQNFHLGHIKKISGLS